MTAAQFLIVAFCLSALCVMWSADAGAMSIFTANDDQPEE